MNIYIYSYCNDNDNAITNNNNNELVILIIVVILMILPGPNESSLAAIEAGTCPEDVGPWPRQRPKARPKMPGGCGCEKPRRGLVDVGGFSMPELEEKMRKIPRDEG